MTAYDPHRSGEMSEDDLDAILAAAHHDLLHYIKGHVDASVGLLALMSEKPTGVIQENFTGAAAVIGLRSLARNLDCDYSVAGVDELIDAMARPPGTELLDPGTRAIAASLALALILAQALDIDRHGDFTRALVRVRDLAFDLDVASELDYARDLDAARDLDYARDLDLDLDLDIERDFALDSALDRDFLVAVGVAFDRVLDLADGHARNRALALGLVQVFARDEVDALVRHRFCDLAYDLAGYLAPALMRVLATVSVDVSGVDLSGLQVPDADVLAGVVWTKDTIWPEKLRGLVRSSSTEIRPGVYRVQDGTEHEFQDLELV